MKTKTPKAC